MVPRGTGAVFPLQIIPVTPPPPNSDAAKQDFWDTTFSQQYDACDVLFVVRDDRGYPAVRSTDPYNRAHLRRKYYRARRLVRARVRAKRGWEPWRILTAVRRSAPPC